MYPRNKPFFSKLSGEVTATKDSLLLKTEVDLNPEIQRGEAILVGREWFRVSTDVGKENLQRSAAPFSVTADDKLSTMNVYSAEFTAQVRLYPKKHYCENMPITIFFHFLLPIRIF